MEIELKKTVEELSSLLQINISPDETIEMEDFLGDLFTMLKSDVDSTVDITNLKYLMHKANVHTENPAMFKAINDAAKFSDF